MRLSIPVVLLFGLATVSLGSVTTPTCCTTGLFNVTNPVGVNFTLSSTTMANFMTYPTTSYLDANGISTDTILATGWQQGDLVNGTVYYVPYNSQTGGGFEGQNSQISHGNYYTFSNGTSGSGYSNHSNWNWFNMATLPFTPPSGVTTQNDSPICYVGEVIVGTTNYLVPCGGNNNYPVFVAFNNTLPITDTAAYTLMGAPDRGSWLGAAFGWDTGEYDGRYVYYNPAADTIVTQHGGHGNGNFVHYDTQGVFTSSNSWAYFDLATINQAECVSLSSTCSVGFQSGAYDGYRYIYLPNQTKYRSVRYDTWGGGTSLNGSGFTYATNYAQIDVSQLGNGVLPPVTGIGNLNAAQYTGTTGWTGAVIAWDRENQNQYLYWIPFGLGSVGTVSATTMRCRIGTMSNGTWSPVDIFSMSTSTGPQWEIMDLSTFTLNAAWPPSWPTVFPSGTFQGYSEIAGYQLGWWDKGRNLVTYNADVSNYHVQHDVDHHLYDPTGWFIGETPSGYASATMGGAFNPVTGTYYPSAPNTKQTQITGLSSYGLFPGASISGNIVGTIK